MDERLIILEDSEHLSGFIAITGPPNAGKSTLLNRLLGRKVAIVSPKPQTTRNRILGIRSGEGYQMVFIDTPGVHRTKTPLHKSMVASAEATFHEVDIVLVMIEMPRHEDRDISLILGNLKKTNKRSILVINKIDKGAKENLLGIMEAYGTRHAFDAIIPISALTGDGVGELVELLKSRLRPGPAFYPKDMTTDQPERFLISEVIREKIYFNTRKELPYSCAVRVDKMKENPEKGLLSIYAHVHVETASQKAILIGHQGKMVKAIGRSSRLDLERLLGIHIFLDLLVKVDKNWSRDPKALRRLGY